MAKRARKAKRDSRAQKPSKAKTASKLKPGNRTQTARKKRSKRAAAIAGVTPALINVIAHINAGDTPPGDLMVGMQIDSRPLTLNAKHQGAAQLTPGLHTTSWGVVSPTVRPLSFGVTIVASDGRSLLNRSNEKTGPDGMGVGADVFTA